MSAWATVPQRPTPEELVGILDAHVGALQLLRTAAPELPPEAREQLGRAVHAIDRAAMAVHQRAKRERGI